MKLIINCLIVTFIFTALIFSRNESNTFKFDEKNNRKNKIDHTWISGNNVQDDDKDLNRKRSNKRRRKIRKPIKGLR